MKYFIPVMLVLVLFGCEQSSLEQLENINVVSSGKAVDEKPLRYLDDPLRSKVSQRGLYRLVRSGAVVDNPDTSTSKAVSKPVIQLVKSTERIPLIMGARMYLQYRIWYLPDQPAWVDLRRVLKHPEMTSPDGSVSTGSDFMLKRKVSVNQLIGYTGYGFDEDYELVEGDWIFEIWYQDKKMIEQTFTTYWPDEQETAALTPVLGLGNKVLGKVDRLKESSSGSNWPRVTVGGSETQMPAGVSDVKQQLDDPLVVMDEK